MRTSIHRFLEPYAVHFDAISRDSVRRIQSQRSQH